jgi:phage terminase large subunit-like protein
VSLEDIVFPKSKEEAKILHGRLRSNFLESTEFFLGHHLTVGIADFQREIYNLLPNNDRILLISPRGHGKSYIGSIFYPIWLSLFELKKNITIISASETLAIDWLRNIKREFEVNERILKLFGNLKSDKWTENHIILNNPSRVNIRARGAQGQIRGFRPDVLICDDLETNETVESEEQRKKLRDWIFKDCLNTLLPGGQFIIIGTLIHPLSVLSDLYVQDNKWIKRKYRAYIDGIQEEGHELWSQMWSHKKLQERKHEIGSWAFASEFLNDPVSDEGAPIKENQIRFWDTLPSQYSCVIAVDPAYSEDEKADYKVASVIAMDSTYNRYLVDYVRTHAPLGEFEDSILNLYIRWKPFITQVGIPSGGTERGFYEGFDKKCRMRGIFPPVVELKNSFTNSATSVSTRNKKARIISALQPLFEQGKYYIHANHIEARDELLTIGSSRWDDVVDTMAYAEQIITPVFYESGVGSSEKVEVKMRGTSGYGEEY